MIGTVALNRLIVEHYFDINPLNTNPTEWSNTLKQLVGKSPRIV